MQYSEEIEAQYFYYIVQEGAPMHKGQCMELQCILQKVVFVNQLFMREWFKIMED